VNDVDMPGKINYFLPDNNVLANDSLPQGFPSPFNNTPHLLAQQASLLLQQYLNAQTDWRHDFDKPDGGKMFGVLVMRDQMGEIGFLSAFSGMLAGQWILPGFVPPLFNPVERNAFLAQGEADLAQYAENIAVLEKSEIRSAGLTERDQLQQQRDQALFDLRQRHRARKARRHLQRSLLSALQNDASNPEQLAQLSILSALATQSQQDKRQKKQAIIEWQQKIGRVQLVLDDTQYAIDKLKKSRASLSKKLHQQLFSSYQLLNGLAEQRPLIGFFAQGLPPGGTGDCAGPKLIQYAHRKKLTPLALAEFWWGASPKEGIRHHGHYYPACRGKCFPILPFMLTGLFVDNFKLHGGNIAERWPELVYEDDDLLVVHKPCGLLSIPGKEIDDSVFTRLQLRYPQVDRLLLVHRLDFSTSGLLIVAKNQSAHKALQKQFLQRSVEKRYVAIVTKSLTKDSGCIELPLRVDVLDRPRQRVCFTHGKEAITEWQGVTRSAECTRVYLYPKTGRTHQLRIHMAHKDGLAAPIVGDELYGKPVDRLLLHAERLCFTHPVSLRRMEMYMPAPF